ncbi:MAG: hypothetical protein LPK03_11975 [Pontibacter sp.]|nr:hypothetical protein [Pontibacter sp.]
MRFKNYLPYVFLLFSASVLVSCDDDDDDTAPSKTELLTTAQWKGEQVLLNNINVTAIPGIGSNAGTFQTLLLTFRKDNTFTADFEAEGQPQTIGGNWRFNDTETAIILESLGELEMERLTTTNLDASTMLSADNLTLIGQVLDIDSRLIDAFSGGNPVKAEMRFVKK